MTPMSTMSKVLSILGSELSETGEIGQVENREIGSFGGSLRPQAGTQLGRTRARIGLGLRFARTHHLLSDRLEGRSALMNDRQMARTRGTARPVREELLDDAILQRMEGDDDKPAAGLQRAFGGKQRLRQFAQLIV